MSRFSSVLFYFGGCVWIAYTVIKYVMGWNVTIRQFLPYHLAAVIPAVILKYGVSAYERLTVARDKQ